MSSPACFISVLEFAEPRSFTCLVRFIPRHFIRFDVNVNGIFKQLSSHVLIIHIIILLNSGFLLHFLFVKLSPRLSVLLQLRIFMITTLNSLSGKDYWSPFCCSSSRVLSYSFIWNIFLCCLILPTSLFLFLFGKFNTFPVLSEVALCRSILWGSALHCPLATNLYAPRVLLGYVGLFVIVGSLLWTPVVGVATPGAIGFRPSLVHMLPTTDR